MSLNSMDNYLEMTYKKEISEIRSKKKMFNKGSNFKTKTMVRTQKSWNDSQNTRRIYTDGIKTIKRIKVTNTTRNIKTNCCSVCVFILFHPKDSFSLQRCQGHTWGYESTILCCEYYSRCFCQVPSSPFLKVSYFTSKEESPAPDKLERKQYAMLQPVKGLYILIQDISRSRAKTDKWRKDAKDKEATLI